MNKPTQAVVAPFDADPNSASVGKQRSILSPFRMQALVVEDNQDLAKLFCDLLQVMGCRTEAAFNARAALESARNVVPDIIFCDLYLPGEKNGFEFARELRADEKLAGTPLIAITGHAEKDENRALDAGFDRIFAKPVKFAEIQKVLNACQDRSWPNRASS